MAIVEFINKPNRTYAGMRAVINYVLNPKKTSDRLTSGIGLNPDNAFNEMVTLKQIMGKTDKRLWYHFIQSFPPYDSVTPELALQVALEIADYFKEQYQILIAVHTDKNHIHTHFVMNTVNIETGRKYTQNNAQRIEIQTLSDKICEKYGLHVLSDEQKNNGNYKKPGQYRAEQSEQGCKAQLKAVIDDTLSSAVNRVDFIRKMERKGYQVKWTDTRENITFTTPSGMKCRDRKLGESEYYNKHNFEMIFEQNAQFEDNTAREESTANAIVQQLSGLSGMFSDSDYHTVTDGFMLQDIDFENMSWQEIQQAVGRLRIESEIRKSRAMVNQTEQEQKAAQQAFSQRMALLDELEQWLYDRKFGQNSGYEADYALEDEWEQER